jgi:hypothetical protein
MLAGPPPADHDAAFSAKNGHKKHEKPRKSHSFSCLFVFLVANISYDKTKVSEEKTWPRNFTDVTRIIKDEENLNFCVYSVFHPWLLIPNLAHDFVPFRVSRGHDLQTNGRQQNLPKRFMPRPTLFVAHMNSMWKVKLRNV